MTVHIALAHGSSAVLFSDSQGTIGFSAERHGLQKQFVGDDFLVGVAGNGLILDRLFRAIEESSLPMTAANLTAFIEQFVRDEVSPESREQIEVVAATACAGSAQIQCYYPGTFSTFDPPNNFCAIGSGAEFVFRALSRNRELGISVPCGNLAEMLAFTKELADAAGESLTVDEFLSVGLLVDQKAYLMADEDITVYHIPGPIRAQWPQATHQWTQIRDLAATIIGEIRSAQRTFSTIRNASLGKPQLANIDAANSSIKSNFQDLSQLIESYCAWYDGVLGR